MSLDAIVRRGARTRPDATVMIDARVSWTWTELDRQVTRSAGALRTLGIGPGKRVAAAGFTSATYLTLGYGAARLGALLCPLNYLSAPDEMRYLVANYEPDVVLAGPEFREGIEAVVQAAVPGTRVVPFGTPGDEWDALVEAADPGLELPEPDPDGVHFVMYTSGTTGRPKGVTHTQRAHYLDGLFCALGYRIRSTDRYVVHAPSFHSASWDHAKIFLISDGSVVVLPRFEPVALMDAFSRHRATVLFGVPAVLRALLSHPRWSEFDLSSIRTVMSGGALGAGAVQREFAEAIGRDVDYLQVYGLTEGGPFVSVLQPELALTKPGSIGRPLPGVEMDLIDADTGQPAGPGAIGEIVIRAPSNMAGYWRDPEATAAALRDGWLHTGDLGVRDADGDYAIVDRLKDMIRSGGENVYAAEVERVLLTHPGIAEAAVVGLPDERWDERVVAVVIARPGAALDPEDVRAHCREALAAYKVPKQVELVEDFPRTGLGKIAKHELRRLLSGERAAT